MPLPVSAGASAANIGLLPVEAPMVVPAKDVASAAVARRNGAVLSAALPQQHLQAQPQQQEPQMQQRVPATSPSPPVPMGTPLGSLATINFPEDACPGNAIVMNDPAVATSICFATATEAEVLAITATDLAETDLAQVQAVTSLLPPEPAVALSAVGPTPVREAAPEMLSVR